MVGLLLTLPALGLVTVLFIMASVAAADLAGWLDNERLAGIEVLGIAAVTGPLGLALFYVPVRAFCARAYRRELAWLEALPFEVVNYEAALAGIGQSRFGVAIDLAADPPSPEELIAACQAGANAEIEVSLTGRRLFISNAAVAGRQADYVGLERTPYTNNAFRRWFHDLATGLLVAIDQSIGIRKISVG